MKKRFIMNRDRIFSIGMAIVSIIVMILTSQIHPTFTVASGSDPGSKTFPYMVATLLLLSSIGKFITCNKPDDHPFVAGKEGWLKLLAVILLILMHTFLMKYIGFIICTFFGTALLLLIMRGDRKIKPWVYIIYPGILTAILYILFNDILLVIMPVGEIWKAIF